MAILSLEVSAREVGKFRRILPQILASVACNFVLLDLNSCLAYSTIIIAQLSKSGEIPLSEEQTSWLGSVAYVCQPVGSLSSGLLVEWLGRRRFMMLLNIPFLTGWLLICFAPSYPLLILANVILGVAIGLTESPINSYIGEVCQPEIRGIMTSCAGVFYQCAFFLQYLLGSLTTWRKAAGINAAIPIFTAIYVFLVPEAPIWLISKHRIKEAEEALCWLRGWVAPSAVNEELRELIRYHEETKMVLSNSGTSEAAASSEEAPANAAPTDGGTRRGEMVLRRIRELVEPPTLRPLLLVIPFFFFVHFSGLTSIRPFMVHVFEEFEMPISGELATVVSGGCGVIGTISMMLSVHSLGKRPLSLVCTAGSALAAILLAVYALGFVHLAWIPLLLFIILSFCNSIVGQMPWMLLSEVFPFRTRGLSGGVSAAGCYVFLFLSSKTYLNVEHGLKLYGAFFLYGSISCMGFVFLYMRLFETEGKSLEDIENHFTNHKRP